MSDELTRRPISPQQFNWASDPGTWIAAQRRSRQRIFVCLMKHCKAVHGTHHPDKNCEACKEITGSTSTKV